MKNNTILVIATLLATLATTNLNAMVRPLVENRETKELRADVEKAKAQGKLDPFATEARKKETQELTGRYLQLGLKGNKRTALEQQEFDEIGQELKTRLGKGFAKIYGK